MHKPFKVIWLICLMLAIGLANNAAAQTKKKKGRSVTDSLRAAILHNDSLMRTLKKSDTSLNNLLQKIEYYTSSFNQINTNFSHGLDTAEISAELPSVERRVKIFRTLIDRYRSSTLRYFYAIRDILTQNEEQLEVWQRQLEEINNRLIQTRRELDSFTKDTSLNVIPSDTALITTFINQRNGIEQKWAALDTINKKALLKVGLMQNRVAALYISIVDEKEEINLKLRNFSVRALSCEAGYIWDIDSNNGTTFFSAFKNSAQANYKLFKFFFIRDSLWHIVSVLIFVAFLAWVYRNRKKIQRTKVEHQEILSQTNYVVSYPLISSVLVATVIIPYIYDHPPMVFLEGILLMLFLSVLILVKRTCPKPLYDYLHQLFWIAVLYSITNLFVESSNTDRYLVLVLSLVTILVSLRFLSIVKLDKYKFLPYTALILRILIVLQSASFICNVMGRFSLAKIIGVTGVYNVWLALGVYLFVQVLTESLFLQLEANKNATGISSYLDFKVLQKKFRSVIEIVAVILWVIMLLQNLNIQDYVYDFVSDFLGESRKLGGTLFTFGSIIIFIVVIWLSTIVSRIISYFYDFAGQHNGVTSFKNRKSTSLLLVRLVIFATGFFLAVAASGFPLDKITIIISAFGVGIGFGLQNIVNNLVSGLILAFEKPVQIGDIIEVANRSGTIKEIGIRSSKILTSDGAEVIVPNGDLISQHVINWTLSNNNRRVELIIGVAYGSDIEKVKAILKSTLCNRDDIMAEPEPLVFVHNFSENAVDFRLFFWAADITTWLELKSRILTAIYTEFEKQGIEIPFVQRDINVRLPDNIDKLLNRNPPGQAQ
jgi:potassium efflux system protein